MLVGDNEKFISALLTFKVEMDPKTGLPTDNLTLESKVYLKDKLKLDLNLSTEALKN